MGVAGVEESGKAEVLVEAMAEIEAIGVRGTVETIEGRDAVEAGEFARAVGLIKGMEPGDVGAAVGEAEVVGISAAGARNSHMATPSAAQILC